MKLTEHFHLSEFTRSSIADAHNIDNTCPSALIPNLKNLCQEVLEPLRQHFGEPIIISSGYRCPELNRLVGGAPNSQHITGEAADIVETHGRASQRDWFLWIQDNCRFDQLILESKDSQRWIHVSCRPNPSDNRQHAFRLKK